MKRRLLMPLLLLMGGAIVNVAVAWGCAVYWVNARHGSGMYTDQGLSNNAQNAWLTSHQWTINSDRCLMWDAARVPGFESMKFYDVDVQNVAMFDRRERDNLMLVQRVRAGWPALALNAEFWQIDGASSQRHQTGPIGFVGVIWVRLPAWLAGPSRRNALPTTPLWPAFAINTVFYTAILWGLFAAPFALRRRRRIKRGLCPKCAYDLRGSASQSCPECGAGLAKD